MLSHLGHIFSVLVSAASVCREAGSVGQGKANCCDRAWRRESGQDQDVENCRRYANRDSKEKSVESDATEQYEAFLKRAHLGHRELRAQPGHLARHLKRQPIR